MASSNCWKCLSRPSSLQLGTSLSVARIPSTSTAPFSTTSTNHAAAGKPKPQPAKAKGARTLRIKKKVPVKTGKPPMPGERKAMRKRIVLSNTNALEVQGMRDLEKALLEQMVESGGSAQGEAKDGAVVAQGGENAIVGSVVGLEGKTVDSLRAVEAFKATQGWGLFRRPGLLVREESAVVSKKLVGAEKEKKAVRMVFDGEKGTGKSLMLIHAMATAFVRGWVVINIPEGKIPQSQTWRDVLMWCVAQEVTNAVTEYAPIPGTKPTLYSQNTYTANLLGQVAKANNAVLQALEVTQQHNLPIPLQSNISLARLCELGARDPDIAWPVFQAFWSEITAEGRPPVLYTLDSLSYIMQNSLYRSAEFEPIHAHDLAIIRHFTGHLSGAAKLPNGGAVMAATSRSHAPVSKSLNLSIKQAEESHAGQQISKKDPFERKYDERAEKAMNGVEVLRLKGLSKVEARGLMEYWAASGVLRSRVDEGSVAEKWALAGNGIVGEIERGALRMRI
jgi:small subunit ribosomal protein S29